MPLNQRIAPIPVAWRIPVANGTTQLKADATQIFFRAPFACQVVDPGFVVASTAQAKTATKPNVIYIYNGGTDGTGTSVIASLTMNKTATMKANVPATLSLSSTAAWAKLDAGDYLVAKWDMDAATTLFGIQGHVGIIYGYDQ